MCMKSLIRTTSKLLTLLGSNLSRTQKISLVLKVLSLLLLLAAFTLSVSSFVSCRARQRQTTSTHAELRQYSDRVQLFRVRLADLVQLETLRFIPSGDTLTVTRTARLSARFADTTQQTTFELHSSHSADTTKTAQWHPLTAECKKKGLAWRRTLVFIGCVIIFVIFALIYCNAKKK